MSWRLFPLKIATVSAITLAVLALEERWQVSDREATRRTKKGNVLNIRYVLVDINHRNHLYQELHHVLTSTALSKGESKPVKEPHHNDDSDITGCLIDNRLIPFRDGSISLPVIHEIIEGLNKGDDEPIDEGGVNGYIFSSPSYGGGGIQPRRYNNSKIKD